MKEYEEKGIKWLISKPRGLLLRRRRQSLRRAGGTFLQSVRIALLGSRMKLNLFQPCIPYRDASLTGCKAEILSVFLPSDTSLRDVD